MNGQVVVGPIEYTKEQTAIGHVQLNTSNLNPEVYLYDVSNGELRYTHSLIKL